METYRCVVCRERWDQSAADYPELLRALRVCPACIFLVAPLKPGETMEDRQAKAATVRLAGIAASTEN